MSMLGFVALFGLFTAHVTGNFIVIGSVLVGAGHGLLFKWLAFPAFPAFVAGIVLARVLDNRLPRRGDGVRACALYVLQAKDGLEANVHIADSQRHLFAPTVRRDPLSARSVL